MTAGNRSERMLQADRADTIVALASPGSPAAVGIIRLSGPAAVDVVGHLVDEEAKRLMWPPRPGEVCPVELCPQGFSSPVPGYLYPWAAGASYTGDSLVEIHTIGSPPVLEALVESLVAAGARLARAGEFTLRAFLSGKMDLTQAEAVLGVVDAADDRSLDIALRQLAGGIKADLENLRRLLVEVVALLEAGLDFPDEEDVRPIGAHELLLRLRAIKTDLQAAAAKLRAYRMPEESCRVVLIGPPNVGKSSLFNALLGGEVALVFDEPGTTRDYLSAPWLVDGLQLTLVDCAGLAAEGVPPAENTGGMAESPSLRKVCLQAAEAGSSRTDPFPEDPDRRAQQEARQQATKAQIEILCVDASQKPPQAINRLLEDTSARRIIALTKADLGCHPDTAELARRLSASYPVVVTSSRTGQGLRQLEEMVAELVRREFAPSGEVVPSTGVRAAAAVGEAELAVDRAIELTQLNLGEELVASELRVALDALGSITGSVYTEEILDQIFSRFCIGK